jgi:hypothetical protein
MADGAFAAAFMDLTNVEFYARQAAAKARAEAEMIDDLKKAVTTAMVNAPPFTMAHSGTVKTAGRENTARLLINNRSAAQRKELFGFANGTHVTVDIGWTTSFETGSITATVTRTAD